jgi:ribulose 1,5-bisphosphate synthetase/thiazole synthase
MTRNKLVTILSFSILFAALGAAVPGSKQVIEKDIVIVGGGAAGSHAAVRLREDFNKTVILIEKEVNLVRNHPFSITVTIT